MQLTITKCNYKNTDKEGKPLIGKKSGKPYWKVGILTNEFGTVWVNGFTPFPPDKWEGTIQELVIKDDPKWGKQFELPPREKAGISETDKADIQKAKADAYAARIDANKALKIVTDLYGELIKKGVVSLNDVPFPMPADVKEAYGVGTGEEPPLSAYEFDAA